MFVSVLGLGVEGEAAVRSFLKYGHKVYASDLNKDLKIDITDSNLELELGSHDFDKILSSDGVSLSPSLFHLDITRKIIDNGLFISDILDKHKSVKTIAVTGTNGKTTTTHMIYKILTDAGYNVAVGGNGGGGFTGYNDLLLEANSSDFDYLLVEVCDMTLSFSSYFFDIDYVVVTNIGYDHLDIHKSIENYTEEIRTFIDSKVAVLNSNDENLMKIKTDSSVLFDKYEGNLNLFGEFNYKNADAAYKLASELGISDESIFKSLESFEAVGGRTVEFNFDGHRVISGKTDNIDALKAVLEEERFETVIFGTARRGEDCRFTMLDYLVEYNPKNLYIFKGLCDDLCDEYYNQLKSLGFENNIEIIAIEDIPALISKSSDEALFIGGNGQEVLTDLNKSLKN